VAYKENILVFQLRSNKTVLEENMGLN